MLVLTRKVGQTIQIGDHVSITITQIKGKNIRIGIDAPAEVAIRRGELELSSKKPQPIAIDETLPCVSHGCSVN